LLHYKYAEVPDAPALAAVYESRCRALALVGRVRVGPDGVNATASLTRHLSTKFLSFFSRIPVRSMYVSCTKRMESSDAKYHQDKIAKQSQS
uniref:tRNA uridine(34) hydroxylase N-terminal domain-containing protein n=1 Tax=Oryza brachyantha TaxID=4533 RepID=J3NE73_ORYBR